MPGFKDFAAGAALAASEMDDYLGAQVNMRYASAAARDADSVLTANRREGMVCYLVDTDVLAYYNGSTWVEFHRGTAQLSNNPLWQQSVNISYTKGRTGYRKVGRDVFYDFRLVATSAGTAGSSIEVELPFPATADQVGAVIGVGTVFDTSAPATHSAHLIAISTTFVRFQPSAASGGAETYIGASPAVTIATGDYVRGTCRYEAASV